MVQVRELFEDMVASGLSPSVVTFNTLLSAQANLGAWEEALATLNRVLAAQLEGVTPNTTTCEWGEPLLSWCRVGWDARWWWPGWCSCLAGCLVPDVSLQPSLAAYCVALHAPRAETNLKLWRATGSRVGDG